MAKVPLQSIPAGHDGNGYITIDGTVYPALKVAKIAPKAEMIKDSKRFLDEIVEQNAVRGAKHSFDLDYYMASSALLDSIRDYENGGDYPDISIQYFSHGKGRGRQEILLTGVILDSVGFGALDDGSDTSQVHSASGTFDDWQLIERYREV